MLNYLYILLGLAVAPAHATVMFAFEAEDAAVRVEMTDEPCPDELSKGALPKSDKIKAELGSLYIYRTILKQDSSKPATVATECYGALFVETAGGQHDIVPIMSKEGHWMALLLKSRE